MDHDTRTQVYVYSTDPLAIEHGDPPPFIALEWPDQRVSVGDLESREAAPAAFVAEWNSRWNTSATEDVFRFFGPMWASANVREVDGGQWEAVMYADRPYRATAGSEDAVKAAIVDVWNTEFSERDLFPRPVTQDEFVWTYNPDG
jgi:hypothetical protein